MTLPTNKACEMAPCPNPWCEALEREGDFSPAVRLYLFGTYRVVCTSCVMEGPPRPTEAEAITAWNTRAPPVTREAERGPAFLLKLANGDDVPSYRTVAAMRLYGPADAHQIDGRGIFLGPAAEGEVRGLALSGEAFDFELSFEDGTKHRERYVVALLEPLGVLNGEQNYRVLLRALKSEPVVDHPWAGTTFETRAEKAEREARAQTEPVVDQEGEG